MFSSVAKIIYTKHTESGRVNKEMEGWEMGGSPELLPCVDDDVDECSDGWLEPLEAAASFHSETMHRVSISSSCSSHQAGEIVDSEKEDCSFKTCHDREAGKMAKQRMVRKDSVQMAGASRSHDTWNTSQPQGRWREITAEIDAVGTTVEREDKYVEQKL